MLESLRILCLLVYKCWLTRKKHWAMTLIHEILLPVGLVIYVRSVTSSGDRVPQEIKTDTLYRAQSLDELINLATGQTNLEMQIFYVPNNTFIKDLMEHVHECFNHKAYMKGFATESQFLEFYRRRRHFHGIAVIFDESIDQSIKRLKYKIRSTSAGLSLYNDRAAPTNMTSYYTVGYRLAQTQICLDRSFINMKGGKQLTPNMFIQRVPYPAHTEKIPFTEELRPTYVSILMEAFMMPLVTEAERASDERVEGVNVLMSMNGISITLNLLSWVISGFLLLSVCCTLPIFIMLICPPGYALPLVYYGNPMIFFLILIFYLGHLLTFGIHVTAYFSKTWLMMTVLMITDILTMNLRKYAFNDSTVYLAPYIGIIFPNIFFYDVMKEINSYETKAEGIQWYNLFMSADPASKVGGSVGTFMLFSLIGTIFHFLMAIYVYAINPGIYGARKHPLYFVKFKSKKTNGEDIESLKYDKISQPYFESFPEGVFVPGIRIRNLYKKYRISIFNKEKVEALRDVSVDFYKGQITILLGHNGAGKTSLMSILSGMTSLTDGVVLINSKNLRKDSSQIMKDMGLCPQENMYFSSLTVSEQLTFFATVKRKDKSRSEIRQDINDLLQKVEMFDKRNEIPSKLSGGHKRRLCLCMALIVDSSIMILDEPTSGLDPESRRVIWNMLLKMRGQKTILISTHDMEEANVLGDKIAILHGGQLKSYGTSLFLKKLIGKNNVQITCSLGRRNDPERIRKELHENGIITSREPGKIVVSIPNSPHLPDVLDTLEVKKKSLGVTGFSVSLISLEQVFLKVTEENEEDPKPRVDDDSEVIRLTGFALYMQTVRALLLKNFTFTIRNYSAMLSKIITVLLDLVLNSMVLKAFNDLKYYEQELLPINLKMYHKPEVVYTSHDQNFSDVYRTVVRNLGGNPIKVAKTDLESAMLQRAKSNLGVYDNYVIAAAKIDKSSVYAFYSEMATYSLPISINLLSNTIIQNILGPKYSISLSSHLLPFMLTWYLDTSRSFGYATASMFFLVFCSAIANFIIQPIREATGGIKQLQKMSGVSGLTYWVTMLISDSIEYALLVFLVLIGFITIDLFLGLGLFGPTEVAIEILMLVLFGINVLPFIYIFSFLNKKTNKVLRLLMTIPLVIVIIEPVMLHLFRNNKNLRLFLKAIFLVLPYVSFLHSQISFFITAQTNARCHWLPNDFYDSWCKDQYHYDVCCDFECHDGKCKKPKKFFVDDDQDISLKASTIYLCITPILYFGILAIIESRIILKWIRKKTNKDEEESDSDEQVEREKSIVLQRIRMLLDNHPSFADVYRSSVQSQNMEDLLFLVYELRKTYKKVEAVRDVSFGVNREECFGLLGVNGAGKTTTFRMMTGGEIPDHGIMYIGDKDFRHNEKYFLSQMGYCPQHDANLESLNTYDHLRLFARLRGIPENKVEDEVQEWIDRLHLNECALRPSGTYSGGNKRRLNIAMALIGNPNLILMDEPTTGVDPGARRSLWNVIKSCQMAGQAVVMTSHSMEECEVLCNKLAIMVDGKLVCIGASEQLKQRFGAGYDIQIKVNTEKAKDQIDNFKNDMPQSLNCVLIDENLGNLLYHVEPTGATWRKMYNVMLRMKSKYDCIDEFIVLSSSLEQLFLLFARTASRRSSWQSTN